MKIAIAVCFCAVTASALLWLYIRAWYGRWVRTAREQVRHTDGRIVPGDPPRTVFGNLPAVYSAANRLAAYNDVHTRFGEIVLFFWMCGPRSLSADMAQLYGYCSRTR